MLTLGVMLLGDAASAEGGVILERGAVSANVACRQGSVEWLGGRQRCGAAVARLEDLSKTEGTGRVLVEPSHPASAPAPSMASKGLEEARRQILLQELAQERARLAALHLAGADPSAMQAQQRARQDVLALERELARLAP